MPTTERTIFIECFIKRLKDAATIILQTIVNVCFLYFIQDFNKHLLFADQ